MRTKSRKKPHSLKPTSPVELARREWSSRNFRIAGIAGSIHTVCAELQIPADVVQDLVAYLTRHNNRDGRAKGLNIT